MNIDNLCRDILFGEYFGSLNCLPNKMSCSKYGDIASLYKLQSFTYFKFLLFWGKVRDSGSPESKIDRSVIFCGSNCSCFCLIIIARIYNNHSGQHSHKTQILNNLMGGSILSECNTCVRSRNFNICFRIGYGLTNLVVNPACGKGGKCSHEWNFTAESKTCSYAYHISFCYTGLEESLRKLLCKGAHLY